MLEITYDAQVNAAYIYLSRNRVAATAGVTDNIIVDYDADGRIVGMEFLNAREMLSADLLTIARRIDGQPAPEQHSVTPRLGELLVESMERHHAVYKALAEYEAKTKKRS